LNLCYPFEQRKEVKELRVSGKNLVGSLDLNDFVNLEKLYCSNNQLVSLKLDNCLKLKTVCCDNNYLSDLKLSSHAKQLTELNIMNNNISEDSSSFSHLVNLEKLKIGNGIDSYVSDDEEKRIREKISQGIYNRFSGSLEFLTSLTKLRELNISNTDLNKVNADKLPRSLKSFNYSAERRPDCKLTEIIPQLDA